MTVEEHWQNYKTNGSKESLEWLFEKYKYLANHVFKRCHYPDTIDIDDYLREAYWKFLQCAKCFDPSKGIQFSTYYCKTLKHIRLMDTNQSHIHRLQKQRNERKNIAKRNYPNIRKTLRKLAREPKIVRTITADWSLLPEEIILYYHDGLNLQEIGEKLGVTKERIRQRLVIMLKQIPQEFLDSIEVHEETFYKERNDSDTVPAY